MAEVAPSPVTASTVMLRVTVRAPDLDTFIQRYCRHLNGDRIFIFTDSPRTVDTRIRFSLQLSNGQPLINGQGVVVRAHTDTTDRRRPPGMELQFKALDDASQATLGLMAAANAALQKIPATPLVRAVIAPPPAPPASIKPPPRAQLKPVAAPPNPQTPPMPPPRSMLRSAGPALPSLSPEAAELEAAAPPVVHPVPLAVLPTIAAAPVTAPAKVIAPAAVAPTMPAWPPTPSSSTSATEIGATAPLLAFDGPSVASPLSLADGNLPANPFMGVSDGALEYFVEWSFEQSVGPHQERAATFSDVSMNLAAKTGAQTAIRATAPDPEVVPDRPRSRAASGILLAALGVSVGIGVGGGAVYFLISRRAPPTPILAPVVVAPPVAAPVPEPEPDRPVPPPRVRAPEPAPVAVLETLRVDSRPPGASLTIDGAPAGRTPQILHLSAGPHQLDLQRERYEPVHRSAEAPGNLTISLRRPASRLHISSTPPAAQVTIGGVARGRTPVDVKLPGFESYKVEVALSGQKPWQRSIYLRSTDSDLSASLSPMVRPATVKPHR